MPAVPVAKVREFQRAERNFSFYLARQNLLSQIEFAWKQPIPGTINHAAETGLRVLVVVFEESANIRLGIYFEDFIISPIRACSKIQKITEGSSKHKFPNFGCLKC